MVMAYMVFDSFDNILYTYTDYISLSKSLNWHAICFMRTYHRIHTVRLIVSYFFQYLVLICSNIFHWTIRQKARKQMLAVLLRVWSCTAEVNGSFVIDFNRSRIWTLCSIRTHRNQSNGHSVILKGNSNFI